MMLFIYRPNFQNSFATGLNATMDSDGSGARITGKIGVPTSGIVFMWMWNCFLGVFMIASLIGLVASGTFSGMWPMVVIPLGMVGFGWLLWTVGTWTTKADQAAILKFLADTVQAKEA